MKKFHVVLCLFSFLMSAVSFAGGYFEIVPTWEVKDLVTWNEVLKITSSKPLQHKFSSVDFNVFANRAETANFFDDAKRWEDLGSRAMTPSLIGIRVTRPSPELKEELIHLVKQGPDGIRQIPTVNAKDVAFEIFFDSVFYHPEKFNKILNLFDSDEPVHQAIHIGLKQVYDKWAETGKK